LFEANGWDAPGAILSLIIDTMTHAKPLPKERYPAPGL